MNKRNYAVIVAGVMTGSAFLAAVYQAGKIFGCFDKQCEFFDGGTRKRYHDGWKKMPNGLGEIYREAAEMLTRTHMPEFNKIIDQTISKADAADYETKIEYLAFIYEKAEDACWAYVEELLEETKGEVWMESSATEKIKTMVLRTVDELLNSWIYRNRLYEIYKRNEKKMMDDV